MTSGEICLLNDSFPPLIDGVVNVVVNYARYLPENGYPVSVVTPECPGSDDSPYPYDVIRYPSLDLRKSLGYTAGNPFSIPSQNSIVKRDIALLHSHCPIMSNILARQIRQRMNLPLVLTYHTKFDLDIANAVRSRLVQESAIHALVESVSSCDELWVVSNGAGENIRSLGYEGDWVVMENGVDLPRGRAADETVETVTADWDLPRDVPVFLFVGRLMWYKGIRLILEALAALSSQDLDYRMVFVGDGMDASGIKAYAKELKITPKCLFVGPVRDREILRCWYTRADLMVFPSTFDTNGLVVREAAACGLPSVLVRGSCAAEGVKGGVNALLVEEDVASLAVCLTRFLERRDELRRIGENACSELYISWENAVKKASERYGVVIDNFLSGKYPRRHDLTDSVFMLQASTLDTAQKIHDHLRLRRRH
ncbi:MAG: glycosyltransferase [Eubacteriaceae bacterium]|nr:glycosyltransferase [Eubacteriaceae bacterium]